MKAKLQNPPCAQFQRILTYKPVHLNVFARLLRETVLSIACQMNDEDALKEAARIFDQWIEGSVRYHPSTVTTLQTKHGFLGKTDNVKSILK